MIIYLKSHNNYQVAIYKYDIETNESCELTTTFRGNKPMYTVQFVFNPKGIKPGWSWDVLTEAEAMLELL